MNLLSILFPARVKRQQMLKVFDELEIGILMCETLMDTINIGKRIDNEMSMYSEVKGCHRLYEKLWDILLKHRNHILKVPHLN
jgi:hypothetical protein